MPEITLPWMPKLLNPNRKSHWAKKAKAAKAHKEACYYLAKKADKPKFKPGPIFLQVTFHPPDNRRRDQDNLIASAKYLLDGIALAWGVDDSRFMVFYSIAPPVTGGRVVVHV